MASQSHATATERLRELVRYCEDSNTTPPALTVQQGIGLVVLLAGVALLGFSG